jgi:hypothetical protein
VIGTVWLDNDIVFAVDSCYRYGTSNQKRAVHSSTVILPGTRDTKEPEKDRLRDFIAEEVKSRIASFKEKFIHEVKDNIAKEVSKQDDVQVERWKIIKTQVREVFPVAALQIEGAIRQEVKQQLNLVTLYVSQPSCAGY